MTALEPAALRRIFEWKIRPTLDNGETDAELRPVLILVGGQPGAGKTRSVLRARHDHPKAARVVGDDFRRHHPEYNSAMDTDPLRMPEVTAQAAGAWVEMSLEYLRESQRSVILETTLRQPQVVADTISTFRDAGYEVELRALAVPAALSRLGTLTRYTQQVAEQGAGRWTFREYHDNAFANMLDTVERVVAEGLVNRLLVITRSGVVLHDRRINVLADTVFDGAEARRIIGAGREPATVPQESARQWVEQFTAAVEVLVSHHVSDPDLLESTRLLVSESEGVVRAAHPHDLAAREEAERAVAQGAARLP